MWLTGLLLASLSLVTQGGEPREHPAPAQVRAESGGIAWFRGSFDQALARARVEGRPLFLVVQRQGCAACAEFARTALAHPAVVAEFADSVCVAIDCQSEAGAALLARYGALDHPCSVWLSPEGVLRERIVGALPPNELLRQARRIRAERETAAELRRRIASDESNVDLRWRLAQKLRAAGDGVGAEEQIARIKELDPSGRSKPMRLMRLDDLRTRVRRTYDEARGAFDTSELTTALEREDDPEVLFRGWSIVADFETGALARLQQSERSTPAQAAAARARRRAAQRQAWPHCPFEELVTVGNQLAWSSYEASAELTPEERGFALEVARRAAELAPEDAAVLDTLACCLHINGLREEALEVARRCVALEPGNEAWRARVEAFTP